MITDFILAVVWYPVAWIIDAVPTTTWADWLDGSATSASFDSLGGVVYWMGSYIGPFAGWVNVQLLVDVIVFFAPVGLAVAIFRGTRSLVSLVTGGGGS